MTSGTEPWNYKVAVVRGQEPDSLSSSNTAIDSSSDHAMADTKADDPAANSREKADELATDSGDKDGEELEPAEEKRGELTPEVGEGDSENERTKSKKVERKGIVRVDQQ